jgi:hypothetical protein
MARDREKLDSAPQKFINLAKIFKKKFSTTVKMQACVICTDTITPVVSTVS